MKKIICMAFATYLSLALNHLTAQANPSGNEITDLWGMTSRGGKYDMGVIFKYNLNTGEYHKVIEFDGNNGAEPLGSLTLASNGRLYGLTSRGGEANSGTIFEIDPYTGSFKSLLQLNDAYYTGTVPRGSIIETSDGNFYFMASSGGRNDKGTIIRMSHNPTSYMFSSLFDGSNGAYPFGDLYQASNGLLYGMASGGGLNDKGVIFYYNISEKRLSVARSFDDNNGSGPTGSFMQAADGQLYGMTSLGGSSNAGVLFKFTLTGLSIHSFVKQFDFNNASGRSPEGSLIQAGDGKLYGMTKSPACIFSYDYSNKLYKTVHTFAAGTVARGSLTLSSDKSTMYGLTTTGGIYGNGMLFQYSANGGRKVLHSFLPNDGINPYYTRVTEIRYRDSDNDGIPDPVDQCPDTPSGEEVDEKGCAQSQSDDDNDGVMNDVDVCQDTPQGEAVNATGCAISQLTYVPDPNFEMALSTYDSDRTINGFIPNRDISGISSLNVSGLGINDLTGIQGFKNLQFLDCSVNNLAMLDLSQNEVLSQLWCNGNNIKYLNVTGNLALTSLNCNNNKLEVLDLNNNFQLLNLYCSDNLLKSLDISTNVALTQLACINNSLNQLDVSNNVVLKVLNCNINALSSLDISKNIALEGLSCAYNELTSLDVRSNTNLVNLFCRYNSISSLDLNKNLKLQSLACDHNNLNYLNIRNGKNSSVGEMDARSNPRLGCIEVDDADAANANAGAYEPWYKDPAAVYSENCSLLEDDDHDGVTNQLDQCPNTPQGMTVNASGCSAVPVSTHERPDVKVYPNPTEGYFVLQLPVVSTQVKVEIYNALSYLISVAEYKVDNHELELCIAEQPDGLYYVKIWLESPFMVKIIKL